MAAVAKVQNREQRLMPPFLRHSDSKNPFIVQQRRSLQSLGFASG